MASGLLKRGKHILARNCPPSIDINECFERKLVAMLFFSKPSAYCLTDYPTFAAV